MILLAEQTQFPVGQGGLHLTQVRLVHEQEIDGGLGTPVSLVYDCGGHGSPKALANSLRQLRRQLPQVNSKRHIDVLVLSHLHSDHINGFKKLVTEMPVSIDRLIIPHYDDHDRFVLTAQMAAATGDIETIVEIDNVLRDPDTWFGERRVRSVVAIAPGEEDDPPPGTPSPERPPEGYQRQELPDERPAAGEHRLRPNLMVRGPSSKPTSRVTVVRAGAFIQLEATSGGAGIRAGTDWVFVPYCLRNLGSGSFAQSRSAFTTAVDAILKRHRSPTGQLVVAPSDAKELINKLTNAFMNYVGRNAAHAAWNVLSVSVFNGPATRRNFHRFDAGVLPRSLYREASGDPLFSLTQDYRVLANFRGNPRSTWWYWEDVFSGFGSEEGACGWMLTGDSVLTNGAALWSRFYAALLGVTAVFQLPHHGSTHNIDDKLGLGATTTPFVTCKANDRHHPDPNVRSDMGQRGLELVSVTGDPEAMLRNLVVIAA
jgi:hypothetical protein